MAPYEYIAIIKIASQCFIKSAFIKENKCSKSIDFTHIYYK